VCLCNGKVAVPYEINSMNYVKAFGLWLGFLAVAIGCGIIREKFLVPGLGPLGGRALGTLLVGVIIFGLIYGGDPSFPAQTWLILDDGDDHV
jgi:hypothetical protein